MENLRQWKRMRVSPRRPKWRTRLGALCLLLVLLLASCEWGADAPADPPPEPDQPAPTAANGLPPDTVANGVTESRQLVLWLPEFFSPDEDTAGGAVLEGAFFQFEQNHPGLTLDVQIKAEFGQAGLLSYLRAAQRVAPAIMPDVVLLHGNQLWQVADLGIVPPLEAPDHLDPQANFPFALTAVEYREQLFGFPYVANVLHGVALAGDVTATSLTWDDMLTQELVYWFPAGGSESIRLSPAVMHYVAAGGTLEDEGASAADLDALETLFEFLALAHTRGVIPDAVLDHVTYESLWTAFVQSEGNLALTTAQDFLREADTRFAYLPAPTASGEPQTLANVWAFAVLTRDEPGRELAFELIDYLLTPEIHLSWAQAAHRLPAQPEAVDRWAGQSNYVAFLSSQLEIAQSTPTGRPFADFARHLYNAQSGLLRQEMDIETAIQEARTVE
jgi:ABC-type glycerol-3-phosphate transport system substrate-binding protein